MGAKLQRASIIGYSQFAKPFHKFPRLQACLSSWEDPKVNPSTVKSHIITNPPMIQGSTVNPADSLEIKTASSPSQIQVETLSPKKVQFGSQDNHSNAFYEIDNKLDLWKTAIQQESSVFDLLSDDESNGNLLGSPTREAHVAFSVAGLGKVGTETPPCSPLQPDRYVSYGCSSPSKAARRLNSSRNLNCVLNDLELEVDAIMQDIEMPQSGRSFELSTGIKDPSSKMKKKLSTVRDHMQLDGQGSKVRSSFDEGKAFCDTENDNEDFWDARSNLSDAHYLDECDLSWKSWQSHHNGDFPDILKYGGNKMPNYDFGGSRPQKKRDAPYATESFSFSDLPASKHQTSENDYDFITSNGASGRRRFAGTSFDFGDVTGHPDWPCFTSEDERESMSLLSEESCSSTAVRGEINDISVANSRARRHQSDFGSRAMKHGDKIILAEEKHFDALQRDNASWSGKCTQMPVLSDSKLAYNINYLSRDKIEPYQTWLFEEGYRSTDMNLSTSSLSGTSEKKHPSSGFKPFAEDSFDTLPVHEPYNDAKFSSIRSKNCSPFKSPPSGTCISKKVVFCEQSNHKKSHDSPKNSKVEFWATTEPDFELESRPIHSSQDDVSHGERLISDLSEQGSINKDEENKSESQKGILIEKNLKVVEDLEYVKYSPESNEFKDRTVETSSNVKISDKSESSVEGKEHRQGDNIPLLSESGSKEKEYEGPKRLSKNLNSSPKLMMLESYVLQLLCVQKLPK
ncbi:uncharacterized protein LOC105638843 isoform X2 [Jatropha curcas]|uniref:uncharacterized protein LOC105638843 isoform X2 n=1 Tax=Jatropha curcas TaxID=180498 RepID=UPI0009D72F87|nr:uncharacterized protein LOC105638843 isoform X2 [Jatropha curcas]XP_037497264.1 uncharacterized protein LOC105638843 isoform X2 [Jatropha curcas]